MSSLEAFAKNASNFAFFFHGIDIHFYASW